MAVLNIFVSITTGEFNKKCQELYQKYNLQVSVSTIGRGTADSALFDYLGLDNNDKRVEFLIIGEEISKKLLVEFRKAVHYEKRGSGIAFIMPLGGVGGKTIMEYMLNGQKVSKQETDKHKGYRYDLVVAVANQGYTEEVMQAARKAGAGGGTVIHAKGTGNQYSEKFFGITLSEEKEIIFIVTRSTDCESIMNAIKENAGIASEAHSIVFTIPVENIAGIASYE